MAGEKVFVKSLEAQTMSMARATAEFCANKFTLPKRQPVECILADSCIVV